MSSLRRIGRALFAFWLVIVAGTAGYLILGFGFVDARYQTVTTITTVGFREVHPLSTVGEFFTIALILVGVGTALYMFGVVLEALVEGHLRQQLRRWRMDRQIGQMTGHFIICGWAAWVGPACNISTRSGSRSSSSTETPPACRVSTIRRCWATSPTTASWRPLASSMPMR